MTGCDPPKKRKKKKRKPALTVTVKTTQPRSHAPSKEYRDEKREERNRQRRADRATQRREKDIQAQADQDKAQFEQWAERQTNPQPATPDTPSVPLGWNGKPLRTCESFCGCEKCWEQCPHWCAGRCRTIVDGEPSCNCPEI